MKFRKTIAAAVAASAIMAGTTAPAMADDLSLTDKLWNKVLDNTTRESIDYKISIAPFILAPNNFNRVIHLGWKPSNTGVKPVSVMAWIDRNGSMDMSPTTWFRTLPDGNLSIRPSAPEGLHNINIRYIYRSGFSVYTKDLKTTVIVTPEALAPVTPVAGALEAISS